jgi:hypothetical protein
MGVLQGKVAIVTGGHVRWRREVCRAFAKAGACVAVIDAESVAAVELAEELDPTGAQVIPVHCDAASGEAIAAAVDWFGSVDILVNNALADDPGVALENIVGFTTACQPNLVPGGHVINVGRHAATAPPGSVARKWQWYGMTVSSVIHVLDGDGNLRRPSRPLDDLDRLIASVAAGTTGMLVA